MQIKLEHRQHRARISTLGAQLESLTLAGREMLWQGDPAIWADHALVLFPFIGRCWEDRYTYRGETYPMGLHGFAWKKEFQLAEVTRSSCLLELTDDGDTRQVYPFAFRFLVGFFLEEGGLRVTFRVENRSEGTMPFALGWHPGFDLEGAPENYQVRFPEASNPREICIVPKCMVTGEEKPLPLAESALSLSRELFQTSARVFRGLGQRAILETRQGQALLAIDMAHFPVTTLWQTLGSGAEFVCLEAWLGRPGQADRVEELGRDGKICLEPGGILTREICVNSGDRPTEKCR